jgi:Tol biopolymer transport system component
LPGTLYVVQSGTIYSLSSGRFHQLTNEDGWMQPSLLPDGNLLVVKRSGFYSDIWTMTRYGNPAGALTHNAAPARSYDTGENHWAFYPRMGPDNRTLFFSYDEPKGGYEVDMSIWSMPINGSIRQGTDWTYSQGYTGGDMQPVPVPGGIIYTKYLRADDGHIASQLWFASRPNASQLYAGKALTRQDEDCRSPALSPDGHHIAMICTYGKQISNLAISTWDGSNLGGRALVIVDQMVAQPTWAPDGSGIAYFAPGAPDAPFQLWFIPSARYFPPAPSPIPTPSPAGGGPEGTPEPSASPTATPPPPIVKPIQMTTYQGFDASSTMAWAP